MDIFDGARVVVRWWFVAVPLVLATLLGTIAATSGFSPVYTTEASVLFVAPTLTQNEQDEVERVNPLLNQSSALVTAAVITSISIDGPAVAGILSSEGLSTDYDVGTEARSPILLLAVRADSSETATATALRLVELIESDVQLRQESVDVPDEFRVSTSIIGLSPVGDADYGSRDRARIAFVVVGLGLSGAIIFGLEGLSRRRARTAGSVSGADEVDADDREVEHADRDVTGTSAVAADGSGRVRRDREVVVAREAGADGRVRSLSKRAIGTSVRKYGSRPT